MVFPFPTASQTIGPYFRVGLDWKDGHILVNDATPGQHITIGGRILDGDGLPVPDALIEIWQADARGSYRDQDISPAAATAPVFTGFGRAMPDSKGYFEFVTIKPGPVAGRHDSLQAPHVCVNVFARGLLRHLVTRMYFSDESEANQKDPLLAQIGPRRRDTLVAQQCSGRAGRYEWNIVLQNGQETVFFEY